ncbi:MAG: diacylglycerol kinase family protein [Mesotoga sp.]|jgi:diacylglycerol kinase|uniref:diacylglycerol kinase family protein n=1 Tax=unclassified Mesotoga TaxID=1184398 RepID=UPI000EF1BBC4|nr:MULTISPECIES: diacylglycerol kinase family protein [unclassified Mesotoga]MDI9368443.1 diacylglycerol kinase family protein [Thermotogota bacterium]NLT44394.1 diacylglycerol kinase family protein [Thermotogaceae bacterium]MDD2333561.1 diacylglycerol kinase family protein [Mesotoga sp.]MDD3680842.1 diacylglycerol kinase family protein [Mesotoga sp.]MDD4207412.1 diacylglycerol kinase family protein [Mesotoga sp.]
MKKFVRSLGNATNGIKHLLKERNFRIQLVFGAVILTLGALLGLDKNDYYWLLFCTLMVLLLEGINTLVEKIADILRPYYDERVRVLKDTAASVVLMGTAISILIGLSIILQSIFGLHFAVGLLFGIMILVIFFFLGLFGGGRE